MNLQELSNIARAGDFQARVEMLMIKAAVSQLNAEDPSPADKLLGQRVLQGGAPVLSWAIAVLTNPTISAGAHSADGSTIPDGDLEFTINSLWAAFAV